MSFGGKLGRILLLPKTCICNITRYYFTRHHTIQCEHMDITRWSTPKTDWLYSLQPKMEKLYTVSKTKLGADCGSDHEFLIAKFRLKLKKVGKTTTPFRYDLNQIPYDYTVEMRNRLMNYGQRFVTLYRTQGSRPSPWKRNAKKQHGCLRRPYK